MSRIGSKDGFTLVEIMLTIAILAIGIIGILRAYTVLLNASGSAYEYIDAVCLAKEKMVEIELAELQDKGVVIGVIGGEARGMHGDLRWEEIITPSNNKDLNIAEAAIFEKDNAGSMRFNLVSYAQNKE